jgi:hypothetical protein
LGHVRRQSQKEELAGLREQLRAQGWTYRDIAARFRLERNVNSRVAFRLAHGLTQQGVADRWNELWPSDDAETPITYKHISYWEAWPTKSGRTPSLKTLNRLARIYCCRANDLLDGEDYSGLDSAFPAVHASGWDGHDPPLLTGAEEALTGRAPTDFFVACDAMELPHEIAGRLLRDVEALSGSAAAVPLVPARERDRLFQQLVHLLANWAHAMDRREMLRILGWAATAATATPVFESLSPAEQDRVVAAVHTPTRVDDTVVGHIEGVLWRCMRQDDTLGPQSALDTVLAQRNLAFGMLDGCPARVRPRLLAAYANLSRFAGWLSFDLNDHDSAWYYYEQARTAAHEAQDTELGALVLCHMSHLATWQRHPRIGIDHALAAQGWTLQTADPLLRAYASDVAARAYAMEGERTPCLIELDRAEQFISVAESRGTPPRSMAYFYGRGQLDATRSQCLLQLGEPGPAITVGHAAMSSIGPSFVRNRAFSALRVGGAYLASGEIDQAARVLGDVARLAAQNGSARLMEEFRATWGQLRPWARTHEVRDLDDLVSGYGLA